MTEYKSGNKKSVFCFSTTDTDSIKLSASPGLDEKISFLIQNYPQDAEDLSCYDQIFGEQGTPIEVLPVPVTSQPSAVKNIPTSTTAANMNSSVGSSRLSGMGPVLSSRGPLSVKREENREDIIMGKLRKKVCRKIFTILRDEYNVAIVEAKETTLSLEEKVNTLFPSYGSSKHYIEIIKTLFKKLKVVFLLTKTNELSLKTFIAVSNQPIDKFSMHISHPGRFVQQI